MKLPVMASPGELSAAKKESAGHQEPEGISVGLIHLLVWSGCKECGI